MRRASALFLHRHGQRSAVFTRLISSSARGSLILKRNLMLWLDSTRISAGWIAINMRRIATKVSDTTMRQLVNGIGGGTFALEQCALDATAIGVVSDSASRRNNAMAGQDQRY